jgi:hypothetical protein
MMILLYALSLNIVTNFIFLKLFWLVGSALASGIGWIFIWLMTRHATRDFAGNFRWKEFLKNLIVILIFSWILAWFHLETLQLNRLQLLWGLSIIMISYALIFMSLNFVEFRRIITLLRFKEKQW